MRGFSGPSTGPFAKFELPHGGAKSVGAADPGMPAARKEQVMRAFASAIRDLTDYIPGPDMGTDERAMAWVRDETGRAVGLPRVIGGIPLDDIGATGFGLAVAAEAAQEFGGLAVEEQQLEVDLGPPRQAVDQVDQRRDRAIAKVTKALAPAGYARVGVDAHQAKVERRPGRGHDALAAAAGFERDGEKDGGDGGDFHGEAESGPTA